MDWNTWAIWGALFGIIWELGLITKQLRRIADEIERR